jgi:pimeloyl-ACP methyl ester carboxylesterase
VRVPAVNGGDTVVLHGDRLITGLTNLLDGAEIRRVPLLLHELRRGDRVRAARILAPRLDPQAGGLARALNRLVNCYETTAIPQGQADSANLLPLRPFRIRVDRGECTLWRTRFATEAERTPVRSDIPTLILAGEYDARTPVENGRRIAQTLTRGYVFELPGMTHGSRPRCLNEIMTRFLEDPTREPDASCIGRMPKLTFSTAWPP